MTKYEIWKKQNIEQESAKFYWLPPQTRKADMHRIVDRIRTDRAVSLRFLSNCLHIPIPELVDSLRLAEKAGLATHSSDGWRALQKQETNNAD